MDELVNQQEGILANKVLINGSYLLDDFRNYGVMHQIQLI